MDNIKETACEIGTNISQDEKFNFNEWLLDYIDHRMK
jgi:hypothetical protein